MGRRKKTPADKFNATYPVGSRVKVQWELDWAGEGEVSTVAMHWPDGDTVEISPIPMGAPMPSRSVDVDKVLGLWSDE